MAYTEVLIEFLVVNKLVALFAAHPQIFGDVALLKDLDDRIFWFSRE